MPGFLESGLIITSRLFLRCAVQSVSSAGKAIGFTGFLLFRLASICSSRKGMVIGAGSLPNLTIPKKNILHIVGVREVRLDIVKYGHFSSSRSNIYQSIKRKNLRFIRIFSLNPLSCSWIILSK